ncbi:J domain-containing protein [Halomonas sp. E14]|uniref:J domain-containing protein n=1 Tax=Halomonas sp. E14 TaxID=3397245 RepID=UPI00403EEDBF
MKEFYLSTARLAGTAHDDAALVTWAERRGGYLWCVWDILPSADVKRAPLTSGYAPDPDAMLDVAAMLGMAKRLRLSPTHHINAALIELLVDSRPFCSASGRRWAVWASPASYLLSQPPLAIRDTGDPPGRALADGHLVWRASSFLRRYLARQRLAARAARPAAKCGQPAEIPLIYARDRYRRDTCHRVISRTPRRVAVDVLPFRPGPAFLHPIWRQHLVDIALLPRDVLERDRQVDHRPSSRTYYADPPPDFRLYDEDDDPDFDAFMNEDDPPEYHDADRDNPHFPVIELPEDSLGWALSVLDLDPRAWPAPAATIKAAFRRAALRHHPDRGGQPSDFRAIRAAYELLARL